MKRLLLTCLFVLAIAVSCKNDDQDRISPEFDRSNVTIEIKIVTHENSRQVTNAYKKYLTGRGIEFDGQERKGWAGWSLNAPYYCQIHVIKSKRIDDDNTMTWGHELQHCVYGRYHTEIINND